MYKEYMELLKLSEAVSSLDRTLKGELVASAKELPTVPDRIVKIDNKMYLVHRTDYKTVRFIEAKVVEE